MVITFFVIHARNKNFKLIYAEFKLKIQISEGLFITKLIFSYDSKDLIQINTLK